MMAAISRGDVSNCALINYTKDGAPFVNGVRVEPIHREKPLWLCTTVFSRPALADNVEQAQASVAREAPSALVAGSALPHLVFPGAGQQALLPDPMAQQLVAVPIEGASLPEAMSQ